MLKFVADKNVLSTIAQKFDQHKKCSIAQLKRIRTSVIHKRKKSRMSLQEDKSSGQQHERLSALYYVFQCRLCLLLLHTFSVHALQKVVKNKKKTRKNGRSLTPIEFLCMLYVYIKREANAVHAIRAIYVAWEHRLREASTMQLYMLFFLEKNACICLCTFVCACMLAVIMLSSTYAQMLNHLKCEWAWFTTLCACT